MTDRLVLVERRADAPPASPGTRIVVLDPAWVAARGERADIAPVLPVVQAVLDEADVIDGSLALLDAWAADARLADRMTADGVSWWFQVRMLVRWDAHEVVLWGRVLARLGGDARPREVVVPASRPLLGAAARALAKGAGRAAPSVIVPGGPGRRARAAAWLADQVARRRTLARASRLLLLGGRGIRHGVGLLPGLTRGSSTGAQRATMLDERFAALRRRPGGVLAVTWPKAFQVVGSGPGARRMDPHLGPPLARLAAEGRPVAAIGLGLDHRRDADWAELEEDETLLPESLLTSRLLRPADVLLNSADVAAGVAAAAGVPAWDDGVHLGPALAAIVRPYAGAWLDWQRLRLRWASRAIEALRPGVLFTDREGSRASWLAAADRAGVPTVSVQHGMIYPGNPEYAGGRHPARTRPKVTCVFGPYERDLLVDEAGYPPAAVVVTGSPRWNDLLAGGDAAADESAARTRLRESLGVPGGARLLVVSVAHNPILGELHTFAMLARVLGGPLPGVHVLIKLHPQDAAEPRHAELLRGLAAAGGWEPPSIGYVRDVDLHALLRAADAHLGQYSTVLSDAVVTGTPNLIAVGQAHADALGYVQAGVAVPVRSVDDVRGFMADPRPPDAGARQRFLDAHYLAGDAVGRTAGAITAAMTSKS